MIRKGTVLVTGASGQDGLLSVCALNRLGIPVVALAKSGRELSHLREILPEAQWEHQDIFFEKALVSTNEPPPRALIHFAAMSSVADSWNSPGRYFATNSAIDASVIEYCKNREVPLIYSASSEMFSRDLEFVSESSPIAPSSPYGVSKAAGAQLVKLLRARGELRASILYMFNHESPLRPPGFLSRSLTDQILSALAGKRNVIEVGSLSAEKDFSWAPDFVRTIVSEALWQSNRDFVLGSGKKTSVRQMARSGLSSVGLDLELMESSTYNRPMDHHPVAQSDDAREILGFRTTVEGGDLIARGLIFERLSQHLTGGDRVRNLVQLMVREMLDGELN